MSVMGSRYTAGLWVTGQISRTGSRGAFALGKKRSKVSSSLKEMKVREHFPLQAGAAAGAASACCGSWSNLQEPRSAPRDAGPGEPRERPQERNVGWEAVPPQSRCSPLSLGVGDGSGGWRVCVQHGGTAGIPSGAPNSPLHVHVLLLAQLCDEGHGDGPVPDDGPDALPLLLHLLLLVGLQALVVLWESTGEPGGGSAPPSTCTPSPSPRSSHPASAG